MNLVITTYFDHNLDDVAAVAEGVVPRALSAAADRVASIQTPETIERKKDGFVVHDGVDVLDGTEVRWSGIDGLTTVEFTVPWPDGLDAPGDRVLAANRFVQTFSSELRAAA